MKNLRSPVSERCLSPHLTVPELKSAEDYWLMIAQNESFPSKHKTLKNGQPLPRGSQLIPFHPLWDKHHSVLLVSGRMGNSNLPYTQSHPVILDGRHPLTKLIILSEHLRLMHAGPTLLLSSLNRRFQIITARKTSDSSPDSASLASVTPSNHRVNC